MSKFLNESDSLVDSLPEFILAIDTASYYPSASICEVNNLNNLKNIKLFKPINTSLKNKRYDAANFMNEIINLCDEINCKPHQISKVAVCFGPGPFSSIRISVVLSRILKKINREIQVYNFDLLYLLLKNCLNKNVIKKEGKTEKDIEKTFCIKAGLKGFFKIKYSINNQELKIIEKSHLMENLKQDDELFSQEEKEINLSQTLLEMMIESASSENLEEFELKNLEDFQPFYGREASVTKAK